MDCPCGTGCEDCVNGKLEITDCPLEFLTWDINQVIMHSDIYEKGTPVAGTCQLDQTQWFLSAHHFIVAEKAFWKKKLRLF